MPSITKQEARTIVGDWLKAKRTETGLGRVRFVRHLESLGCHGVGEGLRFWESGRQMPDMGLIGDLLRVLEPVASERHRILAARLYMRTSDLDSLLDL